ncbi:UDP-2,3-diacylglucosamine diphosphatase [Succinimonas sp.]|uniref:UDP-2,3-diacylglucosamine diphosphatase n=1 Tax=Succinimonas sp. TaxID=1936151 RepID=UPI00386E2292
MAVYFIADLHLAPDTPDLLTLFTDFTGMLKSGDSLYILGDLFGYYVGTDPGNLAQTKVKKQVEMLRKQNIPVYFIHGNRDFLLTPEDAAYFGFELLPERTVITVSGKSCLLMHGDELCTAEKKYNLFRAVSRIKFLQKLFMMFTSKKRRISIAENMREQSRLRFQGKNGVKEKINLREALKHLRESQAEILIHGHTHNAEAAIAPGQSIYDTGDWNGYRYSYIVADDSGKMPELIIRSSRLYRRNG